MSTDLSQLIFISENGLNKWFDEYVIKYFLSYEYYKMYKIYPFGEYSHGLLGMKESISAVFKIPIEYSFQFIEYLATKNRVRGHDLCPCGSKKKIRLCHFELLKEIINSEKKIIYENVYNEMRKSK